MLAGKIRDTQHTFRHCRIDSPVNMEGKLKVKVTKWTLEDLLFRYKRKIGCCVSVRASRYEVRKMFGGLRDAVKLLES